MKSNYQEALLSICSYMIENKLPAEAQYVFNCFLTQEELDRTELLEAENNPQQMASYKMRMNTKREQKDLIIDQLSYFKNIDFKYVAAEFLLWCMTESDSNNHNKKFPADLKIKLASVERFERDILVMASDINRMFKYLSPSPDKP